MAITYEFSFNKGKKVVYVQNNFGRRIGRELLTFVAANVAFPAYYYHYQDGGHVAALHRHLDNKFFFRLDFRDFFYSISRNRVAAALHKAGHPRARTFSKWSCVKNPVRSEPRYSLPIGFVQSPALATMALMGTNIAHVLDVAASRGVCVSVYLDDLIGSGTDLDTIQAVYDEVLAACGTANLEVSARKLVAPCTELVAFNCRLMRGCVEVTQKRIDEFYAVPRSALSEAAFKAYCSTVNRKNV